MRTGKSENRTKTAPLVIENNGVQKVIQVKTVDYPLYLVRSELPIPGILDNKFPSLDLNVAIKSPHHIAGPTFQDVASTYKCDFVGTRVNFSPADFGRTIAKIGLYAAVMAMGLSTLKNAPIRKIILGSDPNIGFRVGSWFDKPVNITSGLHGFMVRMAGVEYHVVIGEVDQSEIDIDNWFQL